MRVAGIIAEYDPFHNGHKYQCDKLRELGAKTVVSIMGGSFSQRGSQSTKMTICMVLHVLKNTVVYMYHLIRQLFTSLLVKC